MVLASTFGEKKFKGQFLHWAKHAALDFWNSYYNLQIYWQQRWHTTGLRTPGAPGLGRPCETTVSGQFGAGTDGSAGEVTLEAES